MLPLPAHTHIHTHLPQPGILAALSGILTDRKPVGVGGCSWASRPKECEQHVIHRYLASHSHNLLAVWKYSTSKGIMLMPQPLFSADCQQILQMVAGGGRTMLYGNHQLKTRYVKGACRVSQYVGGYACKRGFCRKSSATQCPSKWQKELLAGCDLHCSIGDSEHKAQCPAYTVQGRTAGYQHDTAELASTWCYRPTGCEGSSKKDLPPFSWAAWV